MFVFFALSKCIDVSINGEPFFYEFHFKGVLKGKRVERIIGRSNEKLWIYRDQEYLLEIYFLSMKKTDLVGYIKKFVRLEEISY